MILYNMWAISNRIAVGGGSEGSEGSEDSSDAYVRPSITMYRMMAAFVAAIEEMILNGSLPGPFFAKAAT